MVSIQAAFCGVSVNDLKAARAFYGETLGLKLADETMGLRYDLPGGGSLFIYEKADHAPASYTMLNLVVDDINTAVDELASSGVTFEHYDSQGNGGPKTDDKGIARGLSSGMGPDIAWFKDPAGNFISVLQDK